MFHLPSNHFIDSDEEEKYEHTSEHAEDPPVPANETTCLLYDARQQQKERDRFLREEAANDPVLPEPIFRTSGRANSRNRSPASSFRSSSFGSTTGQSSKQPILKHSTPQGGVSARIQFSDSVRISGGIKSKRDKRRISTSSIFAQAPHYIERDNGIVSSTSGLDQSPSPSAAHFGTPRGSFSRTSVGRISRAASFLSEDGTTTGRSRASTPTSIYAPLLLPSKTAPSPSRHFYLTFQRDNGQATYRELVRRQNEGKKKQGARRRGRPKNRRSTKSWNGNNDEGDLVDSDVDDEVGGDSDTDSETRFSSGWCFGLAFWTCGLRRACRRRSRRRRRARNGHNDNDVERGDVSQVEETGTASISDDEESVSNERQENKSEMEVIFGSRPWRYLKAGYWMYRIRGTRRNEVGVEDW